MAQVSASSSGLTGTGDLNNVANNGTLNLVPAQTITGSLSRRRQQSRPHHRLADHRNVRHIQRDLLPSHKLAASASRNRHRPSRYRSSSRTAINKNGQRRHKSAAARDFLFRFNRNRPAASNDLQTSKKASGCHPEPALGVRDLLLLCICRRRGAARCARPHDTERNARRLLPNPRAAQRTPRPSPRRKINPSSQTISKPPDAKADTTHRASNRPC